ncbi:hypothetical protein [Methanimicrococcus stummii]|uniref:fibronectin type III domain-containing protein n=1 Tax=Methanimicrococcus stummii TaxID=3028294 RepID=UPI00292FD432|nr:hypothetical protein [Methanimicrococcus sp. Es2]
MTVASAAVPEKPTYIGIAEIGSSNIEVAWSPVANADYYYVFKSASENGVYVMIDVTSQPKFQDTGLESMKMYYYKVAGYNETDGYGPESDITSARTALMEPYITAITGGPSSIIVDWSYINYYADSYWVYKSEFPSGMFVHIGTTTENRFEDTGLGYDTTYYYYVKSYNETHGVYSDRSNMDAAKTGHLKPIAPIAYATTINSSAIKIEWNDIASVDGYRLYRSDYREGPYSQIKQTTSHITEYIDEGLEQSTTYYYKVSGYVHTVEGHPSDPTDATTLYVGKPVLIAEAAGTSSIRLEWNVIDDAFDYDVYRSLTENGVYEKIDTTEFVEYLDTGLEHSTTYYYKVAAYDGVNRGAQSETAEATTQTPGTTGPSKPDPETKPEVTPEAEDSVKPMTAGNEIPAFETQVEDNAQSNDVKNGSAGFVLPIFLILAILTTGVLYARAKRRVGSKK